MWSPLVNDLIEIKGKVSHSLRSKFHIVTLSVNFVFDGSDSISFRKLSNGSKKIRRKKCPYKLYKSLS